MQTMGVCTSRKNYKHKTFTLDIEPKSFICNGREPNMANQKLVQMTSTANHLQTNHAEIINTRISCINAGNMNVAQRNLILNALMYCIDHGNININDIKSRLKHNGMNCMVIKDKKGTSYVTYRNGMKWSTWRLPYGKYSIIVLHYDGSVTVDDDGVNDINQSPSCESRSVVLAALGYCSVMKTERDRKESGEMIDNE